MAQVPCRPGASQKCHKEGLVQCRDMHWPPLTTPETRRQESCAGLNGRGLYPDHHLQEFGDYEPIWPVVRKQKLLPQPWRSPSVSNYMLEQLRTVSGLNKTSFQKNKDPLHLSSRTRSISGLDPATQQMVHYW